MKYKAVASKGGDQAIIITGGTNPLIIPTDFEHLNNLQAMAKAINSILSEIQEVASTQLPDGTLSEGPGPDGAHLAALEVEPWICKPCADWIDEPNEHKPHKPGQVCMSCDYPRTIGKQPKEKPAAPGHLGDGC